MPRSKSSARWLRDHFADPYVQEAQKLGLRSRAWYKLSDIDKQHHLIKPGMTVVDLGAAPGGWSQYVSTTTKQRGRIIAIDLLDMDALVGVEVLKGDFQDPAMPEQLKASLGGQKADLVLSDMAPNMTGIMVIDQAKSMTLAEESADFAKEVLKPQGSFLVKLFQGEGTDLFIKTLKKDFLRVVVCKPKASRKQSREYYILAQGFRCESAKNNTHLEI